MNIPQTIFTLPQNPKKRRSGHSSPSQPPEPPSVPDRPPLPQQEPILVKIQSPSIEKQVESDIKKETIKNEKTMEQKFDDLVDRSKNVLFRLQSAIPLDPFPDVIEIDVSQVHITFYNFFKSKRLHSIALKDISNVFVETTYMFGNLKIVDRNFVENEISIPYLKRDEAIKAKKIIQGLMISDREKIDLSQVHDNDLAKKLEELGSPTPTPNKD